MPVVVPPLHIRPPDPTACTLFKGTRTQVAYVCYPQWGLNDQILLRTTRDSRQARRQECYFWLRWARRLASASAGKGSHFKDSPDPSNPKDADSGEDDDDPANTGGRGRRPKKRRRNSDSEFSLDRPEKKGKGSAGGGDDGGEDDDEYNPGSGGDGGRKDPSRSTAGKTKKAKVSRKVSNTAALGTTAVQDEFTKKVSEMLETLDSKLRNTKRIARRLQEMKLTRFIKAKPLDLTEVRLQEVRNGPRVVGRDIRPLSRKREDVKSQWVFSFKNHGSSTDKPTDIAIPFASLAKSTSSKEQDQLHKELAGMYNTWQWTISKLANDVKQQWISVALSNVFAEPLQVDEVTHGNTVTYKTNVHYIEAGSGAHKTMTISAAATKAYMQSVTVPPLPVLNIRKGGAIFQSTPENPHRLAATTLANVTLGKNQVTSLHFQHLAEDAVYWLASHLQGLVATDQRMRELYVMYRTQIGLQKAAATKAGLYGGEADLYTFSYRKASLQTLVEPTTAIAKDMGTTARKMVLNIYSLDASRATPVMESVVQHFCAGHDIRYAWLEAAKTADAVNEEIAGGVPGSSACDCTEAQTGTEMHVCQGCAKPTLYKNRSYDSMGRLVCAPCQQRDQTRTVAGRSPGESLAAYITFRSLWLNFKIECDVHDKNPKDKKHHAIFKSALDQIVLRLPGKGVVAALPADGKTTYTDEWTGKSFDVGEERAPLGSNPSRRRHIPGGISVDTIHRQGHPDHEGLKHSPDNLKITSNACQMGKMAFLSGILHEIGEFKRLSESDQEKQAVRETLVKKIAAMTEVNCKRPYINAGTGDKYAKYNKIIAESVAGRVTANEPGPWEASAKEFVRRPVSAYRPNNSLWNDDAWMRAQECAKSMEKYFGVKLLKLKDGTRWMGSKDTNPDDLDRNGVMMLCRDRLYRMRVICNKKWPTKDNEEKIYREILFQHCCSTTKKPELAWLKKKYGDQLGLPLVVWKHDPLRFSLAHRHHGFGMATGWLTDAADVKERLENDENNNMLIESWFLNSAKLDMAEEYYEQLYEILSAAKITDVNIYAPGTLPTAYDATPTTDASKIETVDEFARATFNVAEADDEGDEDDKGDEDREGTTRPTTTAGSKDQDTQMTGTEVEGGANSAALQQTITGVYTTIINNETLRENMAIDPDFRRLLAKLQGLADEANEDGFAECIGQVYEAYLNVAQ